MNILQILPQWAETIVSCIFAVLIGSSIIVVLSENKSPIRALAWILALILLPVAGLVFYLFFGRGVKSIHLQSRRRKRKLLHNRKHQRVDYSEAGLSESAKTVARLAEKIGKHPVTIGNEVEIFTDGMSKFEALKSDLAYAEKFILFQYYIFNDDQTGREIAEILMQKAREGVEVYVIYDHVGSFSAANSFFRKLKNAGVKAQPFFRVTFPQFASRINWRNHRKIVVIDGKIGYLGGMNIANRYVGRRPTNGRPGLPKRLPRDPKFLRADSRRPGDAWRDTHMRVCGPIVDSLQNSFILDWGFTSGKTITLPEVHKDAEHGTGIPIQFVSSGPADNWDNLSFCFLRAISSARKSIFIQTPYFLPTEALDSALESAALSGIDVRIMLPRRSDSKLLQYASFSYISRALQAGIKIYLYDPGMLHCKTMTIDDSFGTIGSCNFDFRSFENNFECNLFLYDRQTNAKMRDIFFKDLESCTKLTPEFWHKRPRYERALESLLRLFAPIL